MARIPIPAARRLRPGLCRLATGAGPAASWATSSITPRWWSTAAARWRSPERSAVRQFKPSRLGHAGLDRHEHLHRRHGGFGRHSAGRRSVGEHGSHRPRRGDAGGQRDHWGEHHDSGRRPPAPGPGPQTLSVGTLSLNPASILDYQLGTPGAVGSGVNTLVNVAGNLTLDGVLNVTLTDGGQFGSGSYRLLNYKGALTDLTLTWGHYRRASRVEYDGEHRRGRTGQPGGECPKRANPILGWPEHRQ